MEAYGLKQINSLGELDNKFSNPNEIKMKLSEGMSVKNIKKAVIMNDDSGTIFKKNPNTQLKQRLRNIDDPKIKQIVADKVEVIEQELLYSNYDSGVEGIIDTLKYLESL